MIGKEDLVGFVYPHLGSQYRSVRTKAYQMMQDWSTNSKTMAIMFDTYRMNHQYYSSLIHGDFKGFKREQSQAWSALARDEFETLFQRIMESGNVQIQLEVLTEISLSPQRYSHQGVLLQLKSALKNSEHVFVIATLIKVIGQLSMKTEWDLLHGYLKHEDRRIAANTLEALTLMKDIRVMPYLERVFKLEDSPQKLRLLSAGLPLVKVKDKNFAFQIMRYLSQGSLQAVKEFEKHLNEWGKPTQDFVKYLCELIIELGKSKLAVSCKSYLYKYRKEVSTSIMRMVYDQSKNPFRENVLSLIQDIEKTRLDQQEPKKESTSSMVFGALQETVARLGKKIQPQHAAGFIGGMFVLSFLIPSGTEASKVLAAPKTIASVSKTKAVVGPYQSSGEIVEVLKNKNAIKVQTEDEVVILFVKDEVMKLGVEKGDFLDFSGRRLKKGPFGTWLVSAQTVQLS